MKNPNHINWIAKHLRIDHQRIGDWEFVCQKCGSIEYLLEKSQSFSIKSLRKITEASQSISRTKTDTNRSGFNRTLFRFTKYGPQKPTGTKKRCINWSKSRSRTEFYSLTNHDQINQSTDQHSRLMTSSLTSIVVVANWREFNETERQSCIVHTRTSAVRYVYRQCTYANVHTQTHWRTADHYYTYRYELIKVIFVIQYVYTQSHNAMFVGQVNTSEEINRMLTHTRFCTRTAKRQSTPWVWIDIVVDLYTQAIYCHLKRAREQKINYLPCLLLPIWVLWASNTHDAWNDRHFAIWLLCHSEQRLDDGCRHNLS